MKKLFIFVLFLSILTGCSEKKSEPTANTSSPSQSVAIEVQDMVTLTHDINKVFEGDSADAPASVVDLYLITDTAIGYRLDRKDFDGKVISGSASRSNNNSVADPNEVHNEPMYTDITLETRGEISTEDLADSDYTYFTCKAIFEDLSEKDCINTLKVENLAGFQFGPVYIIEKDGDFFFSSTK